MNNAGCVVSAERNDPDTRSQADDSQTPPEGHIVRGVQVFRSTIKKHEKTIEEGKRALLAKDDLIAERDRTIDELRRNSRTETEARDSDRASLRKRVAVWQVIAFVFALASALQLAYFFLR